MLTVCSRPLIRRDRKQLKMKYFFHVLVITIICLTDEVTSSACTNYDDPIYGYTGKCIDTATVTCPGSKTRTGLCPGGYSIKCCFTVSDSQCDNYDHGEFGLTGKCMSTSKCPGAEYISDLCPSYGAAIKCCFTGVDQECKDYTHSDYGSDGKCVPSGHCPTRDSNPGYVSNLCPSYASDIKCCFTTSDFRIVARSVWDAEDPVSTTPLDMTPVPYVFIHHTASSSCSTNSDCQSVVKNIQNYHMNTKGWDDIGYSFLVGEDGNVYEGRGWDRRGAHTVGYNADSIAFSFMGDFTTSLPNAAAVNAVKLAISYGVIEGKIATDYTLSGHRDASNANTACPGNALYTEIQGWDNYEANP